MLSTKIWVLLQELSEALFVIEPVSFQIEFGKFNTDIKKISFPPGIHVIYGESGTGKSSFIKKMAGMEIDTICLLYTSPSPRDRG